MQYILWLLWNLLLIAPDHVKNPTIGVVLSSMLVVQSLMITYSLDFAPGLLDVLQSATPPTVAWFANLPNNVKARWAVYLLILRKAGCRIKIYIGSATNAQYGAVVRFANYDTQDGTNLPYRVKKALEEGYVITNKGLLCWCPIPPAGKYFSARVLFHALEAMFAFVFWAMVSKDKDYGVPIICPWRIEDLEYDGLCSHSALWELVFGETDNLTSEQRSAREIELKERRRAAQAACTAKRLNALTAADYAAYKNMQHNYYINESPEQRQKRISSSKKIRLDNRASGKYSCHVCSLNFDAQWNLTNHYKSEGHKDKVAGINVKKVVKDPGARRRAANKIASKAYYCKACDYSASMKSHLERHQKTAAHARKAAAAAANGTK